MMMRNLLFKKLGQNTSARKALRPVSIATAASVVQKTSTTQQHVPPIIFAALGAAIAFSNTVTSNHCQVPCGIFDDPAMVNEVRQACKTIRKAIDQSQSLYGDGSDQGVQSVNQIVRWINTKEEHCNKIIHLMADYCLCQRVKRDSFHSEADYLRALKMHHAVMQAAMKAKQSTDLAACDALEHAVEHLAKMYS